MSQVLDEFAAQVGRYAGYREPVARVGLGLVILFAGLHKLVAPEAWTVYVTPWLAGVLPVSARTFMLINGVLEPPFALALLLDRFTFPAAAFVAVSLAATVAYLAIVAATSGEFVTILIRDVGLTALALVVTGDAASASMSGRTET